MAVVSIQRKREILDSAKGQFFHVTFVKQDGSVRDMQVKKWTEAAFTYGSKNARPNTVAHKPEYYTAVDVATGQFRNINLNTLMRAKVAGIEYKFD